MDKIATWTCDWCNRTSRPLTDVRVEYNDSLNIMAFVGYLEDHNAILVTFRGTEMLSLRNWLTNIQVMKTEAYDDIPGAKVHTGFYKAFRGIKYSVRDRIVSLMQKHGAQHIFIVGHSLGGALSQLMAVQMVR